MNKRGFVSLYALVILQIITIFCILLISSASAIAQTLHAEDTLHHAQLASIYRIKARLMQEPASTEEEIEEEETDREEERVPPPKTTFLLTEETMQVEGCTIHLAYQDEEVFVQVEDLSFVIKIDPAQKTILDLVYDEGNSPS